MNKEFWLQVALYSAYVVGIFGGMCALIFLWFLVRELIHPTNKGAAPDSAEDTELASEIGRASVQLAAHRAATIERKDKTNG